MSVSPALEKLMATGPYSLPQREKRAVLTERTRELTRHHYERCDLYRKLLDRIFGGSKALQFDTLEDAPFIPVSLFKTRELRSVESASVIKILTSSGTTGQAVSRIHLDVNTAQLQSRALVKIMQHFLGMQRRPMVFLDHAGVVRDRRSSSARAVGILGMLPFGRQPFYALRDDMSLDVAALLQYIENLGEQSPIFFGLTYIVWQYFVEALEKLNLRLCLDSATLLHSGGWKKLEGLKVSPAEFRQRLMAVAGIKTVINFYGMVEQVGSVYFENPLNSLHTPIYSDVIVRDTNTLQPLPAGRAGLIQLISALPESYPGHSLLTEDIGIVEGCDDSATGMNGQYFRILGRLPKADLRGCSDTFQKPLAVAT